jgi:hypothetical protein
LQQQSVVEELIQRCPRCGRIIPTRSGAGRPTIYCSVGCRRAAEYEIRCVNGRLAALESRLIALRLISEPTGWEDDPALLQAEIEVQRARLAELLDAGED